MLAVWPQVKDTGGTVVNLAQVFPDLAPDSQIPVIAGDYVLIEWWATTMASMGQSLSAAKRFFSQNPPPAAASSGIREGSGRFVAPNGGCGKQHAR